MYNQEGNIVFSAEVDGSGDIIVTTVNDDNNTITSSINNDANSIPSVDLGDDLFALDFFDCCDDDASSVASSHSSICSPPFLYQALPASPS